MCCFISNDVRKAIDAAQPQKLTIAYSLKLHPATITSADQPNWTDWHGQHIKEDPRQ